VNRCVIGFLLWVPLLMVSCGVGPVGHLQDKLEDYQDRVLRLEIDATLDMAADLARSRLDDYRRVGYADLQTLGGALNDSGLAGLAGRRGVDAAAALEFFLDLDQMTRVDGASAVDFARLFSEWSSRAEIGMTASLDVLSSCVSCRESRDSAPTIARLALIFSGDRELADSFRRTAVGLLELLNSKRAVDIMREISAGDLR
jgi:hypothetical protein